MTKPNNPLRINVGFLVKADAGYSRSIDFDVPQMVFSEDFSLSDLKGSAEFGRTPQGLVADVHISGRTQAECARCLDTFQLPVATEFTELFAFDERHMSESQLLVPADHQIDLAPLAREYLVLDMPMTPLCRKDCKGLCPVCGANRNHEDCGHEEHPGDPRLSILKDLLDPNE